MPIIIVAKGDRIEHINVTDITFDEVVKSINLRANSLRETKYNTDAETRSINLEQVEWTLRKVLREKED